MEVRVRLECIDVQADRSYAYLHIFSQYILKFFITVVSASLEKCNEDLKDKSCFFYLFLFICKSDCMYELFLVFLYNYAQYQH